MRRQLFLLRHAKSRHGAYRSDAERPLAPQGERDAQRLAAWLEHGALPVQLVLCSPARRTDQTLTQIRPALPDDVQVRHDPQLYGASATTLLQRLADVADDLTGVLVVGHNPGLHHLAVILAGDGDARARALLQRGLPTGTLVALDVPAGSWRDVHAGAARLTALVRPDDLP